MWVARATFVALSGLLAKAERPCGWTLCWILEEGLLCAKEVLAHCCSIEPWRTEASTLLFAFPDRPSPEQVTCRSYPARVLKPSVSYGREVAQRGNLKRRVETGFFVSKAWDGSTTHTLVSNGPRICQNWFLFEDLLQKNVCVGSLNGIHHFSINMNFWKLHWSWVFTCRAYLASLKIGNKQTNKKWESLEEGTRNTEKKNFQYFHQR